MSVDVNDPSFPNQKYLQTVKPQLMKHLRVGTTREELPQNFFVKQFFKFKGYTLHEKRKYLQGMMSSGKKFMHILQQLDIENEITELSIPVLLIHGAYDYQVSQKVSNDFFLSLAAPQKECIVFESSAHFPHFEEPVLFTEKVHEYLTKVLNVGK